MKKQGFYVWLIMHGTQPICLSTFSNSSAAAKKRILACNGKSKIIKDAIRDTPYTSPVLALPFDAWKKHNTGPHFKVS